MGKQNSCIVTFAHHIEEVYNDLYEASQVLNLYSDLITLCSLGLEEEEVALSLVRGLGTT